MNILVLNGSPKGEKRNTYQLTKTFFIERAERSIGKLEELGGESNG